MKNNLLKQIYITVDVDWAIDPVMEYCLVLFDELDINTTINITHETKLLNRMKQKHELGIHPNFNFLLNGQVAKYSNYQDAIAKVKDIVPTAVTVRSHACVSGSQIRYAFAENNLKYELNTMIIPSKGQCIYPWKLADMWQVPYIFEDDVFATWDDKRAYWFDSDWEMVRVLNFHPIHIFLNTESLDRYNTARPYLQDIDRLSKLRNLDYYGTEVLLRELVAKGRRDGFEFKMISDLGGELE